MPVDLKHAAKRRQLLLDLANDGGHRRLPHPTSGMPSKPIFGHRVCISDTLIFSIGILQASLDLDALVDLGAALWIDVERAELLEDWRGAMARGAPKLRDSYLTKEKKHVRHLWMD